MATPTRTPPPLPQGGSARCEPGDAPVTTRPTIFHVTHWKAGSQWIYSILRKCVPRERIVKPLVTNGQFLEEPLQNGKVYPTVYVTKEQFDGVRLPADPRRFVVVRDLRDTLVSGYFSMKISHPVTSPGIVAMRTRLQSLNLEDGLVYLMDEWLTASSAIQSSWLAAGEPVIRYEDLLNNDVEILERVLLDECGLETPRARFGEAVRATRFECGANGRRRGEEDITHHMRKGIVGDWHNHFTEPVKEAFKARFANLLIASGYAQDWNW